MTGKRPTIGERVEALERAQGDLLKRQERVEQLTERVRKDQSRMRAEIRKLERNVPAKVQQALNAQTADLKIAMAQTETRNADRITSLARQWPAGSIVAASILGTTAAGFVVDLVLAAFHGPHIG